MLYWTIVELILRDTIAGLNNTLLDQEHNFSMQHLKACIVDFYFNIKDIEIYYSEKWSIGYEVNIVGCKVLATLGVRFQTLGLRYKKA